MGVGLALIPSFGESHYRVLLPDSAIIPARSRRTGERPLPFASAAFSAGAGPFRWCETSSSGAGPLYFILFLFLFFAANSIFSARSGN
jgi:hypothetical protein